METPTPTTTSSTEVKAQLQIVEIKPGLKFTVPVLQALLTDADPRITVEQTLFFGKLFELDFHELSHLFSLVVKTDVAKELQRGDHSTQLQGYIVDDLNLPSSVTKGTITFSPSVPTGEILPELWRSMQIEVADSIKTVAQKVQSMVGEMPGKKGSMVLRSMMKLNKRRPTLGLNEAAIHHAPVKENLVIFDVSGSMTQPTVQEIVDDVVALSFEANAHLAVVSNTTTHWEPGSFNTAEVLKAAEFGGTQYETLGPLLNRDYGVVVTIADYDSSASAFDSLARRVTGHIDQVLDISLVNKPTFLAECVGQFATEVRPVLIANDRHPAGGYPLGSGRNW